jgi:glc operon protein GlcG
MDDQCRLSLVITSVRFRNRKRAGRSSATTVLPGVRRLDVKKLFAVSGTVMGLMLSLLVQLRAQEQGRSEPALQPTRDVKVISSAGARALADACTAWAEQNKQIVAMAILDWGGNLIESHAMEGAPMNAIDTALLKAKSALRWRRPTSETNKMVRSGENLAPTFMHDFPQPGVLPILINGQVVGAMGVSGVDGEKCAQAAIDAVFEKHATATARATPR